MPEPSHNGARSKGIPLARVARDAVEGPVTRASQSWVNSTPFMDGLALTWRLQRRVQTEVQRGLDVWFGAWHLPTRSDVARLSNEIASLERQVRDLRSELERTEPALGVR